VMAPPETAQQIMNKKHDPAAAETARTTDSPAVAPSTACYASLVVRYEETLSEEHEADRDIMAVIKKWLPAFERTGQTVDDLVYAMIHNSASDEDSFETYLSGFLSEHRDPTWKFDPWTGESISQHNDKMEAPNA